MSQPVLENSLTHVNDWPDTCELGDLGGDLGVIWACFILTHFPHLSPVIPAQFVQELLPLR